MSTIVVQGFTTFDGVAQGGGGPDEDREGGFELGGWATSYDDRMDKLDEGGKIVLAWESRTEALLLGRKARGAGWRDPRLGKHEPGQDAGRA